MGYGKPSYGGIGGAMASKEKSIEKAQNRKEDSIQVAGTARDATLITVALMSRAPASLTPAELDIAWKKRWLDVRQWLWNNYDIKLPERKDAISSDANIGYANSENPFE